MLDYFTLFFHNRSNLDKSYGLVDTWIASIHDVDPATPKSSTARSRSSVKRSRNNTTVVETSSSIGSMKRLKLNQVSLLFQLLLANVIEINHIFAVGSAIR
jgi:hypothetical protein